MTSRSTLRALLAGVALCTAAGPAAAEPTTVEQCLRDVDCVTVSADPRGDVSAASGGHCAPETVASACVPGVTADPNGDVSAAADGPCAPETVTSACVPGVTAGTTGGAVVSSDPTHAVHAGCHWEGSPGSRIDILGQLTPLPPPGVQVVGMSLTCSLRVNHVTRLSVAGIEWQGSLQAHKTDTSTSAGDHVVACLNARVNWSDGTSSSIASGGACLYET